MFVTHKSLPKGSWKVRYEAEFYRLKSRKRQLYEANREYRYNMRFLLWSRYARLWYERRLTDAEAEENLEYYTRMGWAWLWPEEDHQKEIRDEVNKSGLSYWALQWRRHNEMEWERKKAQRNDGDGYQYWLKFRREQIDKLKIKKK